MWQFSGFNGFGQFGKEHSNCVRRLTNFSLKQLNEESFITPDWSYNLLAVGRELFIFGSGDNTNKNKEEILFEEKILSIGSTNNYILVLLISGKLFKLVRKNLVVEEIKFIHSNPKNCRKRKYSDSVLTTRKEAVSVERIGCGNRIAVVITSDNCVYSNSNKIAQYPDSEKIVDLQCGFEHALVLNSDGDIYTWGNGLRGQLGIDDLRIQESPIQIKALSGIKIISIAAGGWHSASVSSFGDVYTWGLNCSGQLGIRVFTSNGLKNTTIYAIPQLPDVPECLGCNIIKKSCSIVAVYCGARHTIVKTLCGSILSVGWNKYGQLGLVDTRTAVDKFERICEDYKINVNLFCGPWCTVLKFNL